MKSILLIFIIICISSCTKTFDNEYSKNLKKDEQIVVKENSLVKKVLSVPFGDWRNNVKGLYYKIINDYRVEIYGTGSIYIDNKFIIVSDLIKKLVEKLDYYHYGEAFTKEQLLDSVLKNKWGENHD